MKAAAIEKIGAIKEGSYQKYFYTNGEFKEVTAYRLFHQERKR
jgi:RimJ/RimL family protein N-acetyltransferase